MERGLQVAGTVLGLLGGFVTALWEIFLSPYAGALVVLAPALAIVGNVALILSTRLITGRHGLAMLPGLVWFLTMFGAAQKTTEGDLLIPGNDWPGLIAMLAGTAAYLVTAYVLAFLPRRG